MYAGALPFLFGAVYFLFGWAEYMPGISGSTMQHIVGIYGLVIASFMAGSLWGLHLNSTDKTVTIYIPILSNIAALALWVFFVFLAFSELMLAYSVMLLGLLAVDRQLCGKGVISQEYLQTRIIVSLIVIACLLTMAISA